MGATIALYLLMQGISTLLWLPLSNSIGRRRTYIYSLSIYVLASVFLVAWPNLETFIILRGIQGIGTAAMVPLGYATIDDITLPAERSNPLSTFQWFQITTMLISPFLGGLLSNFLGFRAVLIFPMIVAVVVLLVAGMWLPETLQHKQASSPTSEFPLDEKKAQTEKPEDKRSSMRNEISQCLEAWIQLRPMIGKDTVTSLGFAGVVLSVWMMVTVSTPQIFTMKFSLNDFLLGMALLPSSKHFPITHNGIDLTPEKLWVLL